MDRQKVVIGGTWFALAAVFALYFHDWLVMLLFLAIGAAFMYTGLKPKPKVKSCCH